MKDLSGEPGCDLDNNPQSTFLWMQSEIRNLKMPIADCFLFCDIWTNAFVKIMVKLKKRKIRYDLCDLYNATWAYLGYTENQCPKAVRYSQFLKDN